MFAIIYEKSTGNVKHIIGDNYNIEELHNVLNSEDDVIEVTELLSCNPYRAEIKVVNGQLVVVDKQLSEEEEKIVRSIELKDAINDFKLKLDNTDYQAIKFAEGILTEEEYAPIRQQRQEWRDEINRLEAENEQL